jgi:hypothetical protein
LFVERIVVRDGKCEKEAEGEDQPPQAQKAPPPEQTQEEVGRRQRHSTAV